MSNLFSAVMISCHERDEVRSQTLRNLAQTDWRGDVTVVMEGREYATPQERQHHNALEALKIGLKLGAPYILFLEDDLEFNRFIFYNVSRWPALPYVTMASLYNPNIHEICRRPESFCFEADPNAVYGSQAYIFSNACADYVTRHWHEVEGMQDIKASRLAARLKKPILYFTPSLVQHVGRQSTFGGGFHQTRDYDPEFLIPQPQPTS